MTSKIYCFVENNDWEGEKWNFYFEATEQQIDKLTELVDIPEIDDTYWIMDKTFTRKAVDKLLAKVDDSGYMPTHNWCGAFHRLIKYTGK